MTFILFYFKIPELRNICLQGGFRNCYEGFPGGSVMKSLSASAGDTDTIPDPAGSHMPRSN